MINILHITPAFYPATYWGGPINSVYGLCNALIKIPGTKLKVLTTNSAGPSRSDYVENLNFPMIYPGGYEVFFCKRIWGDTFSPEIYFYLWPMIKWADIVHLTAVYSSTTIPTLLISRLLDKPVIWSPRGALQGWEKNTNSSAKRFYNYICRILVKPNNCILHFTSENEAVKSISKISSTKIEIIPNGVDIPEKISEKKWKPSGQLRLLYLGRLHPIKGIENLILAIKQLKKGNITLNVYGCGDEKYFHSLQELVNELKLDNIVHFKGYLDNKGKMDAFMQSDVCVVPSYTENFGMVVAESLAHGVPVIASRGTPWEDIEKNECGYWIDNNPDSIALAIQKIVNTDLAKMGNKGRQWMAESYNWNNVTERMYDLYRSCIKR